MQKSPAKKVANSQLCMLRPGVYMAASDANPLRVVIKAQTPAMIVEKRDDKFVVAMIDCQTLIFAHQDSIEELQ